MASDHGHLTDALFPWRGIHHIALATTDLDATRHFYAAVLGMSVSDILPSRDGRGRHCLVFVKPGDPETWGLHFFERPHAGGTSPVEAPLLHIAFRLPDDAAAQSLRERLRAHGVEVTEIPELGSFIFWDNTGIMLEVTVPKR